MYIKYLKSFILKLIHGDVMRHSKYVPCLTIFIIIISIIIEPIKTVEVPSNVNNLYVQPTELADINFDNVLQHIQFFSNLGSRVIGYDGFFKAADYVKNYWSSLGLQPYNETFQIVTPIVVNASLSYQTSNGQIVRYEIYPLWPNHVNPCPYTSPEEGDRLVFVSKGLPEDFNGVDVKGAFVLIEFNDLWYWKNAIIFGAKGVIFIEPDTTTGSQSVQKCLNVPVNFPRLYIKTEEGIALKQLIKEQGEIKIWINSKMVWQDKDVANIIAVIEGTDESMKNEVAVMGAYYDSWCSIPQLNPGATDSMGIAFLLELSRLLTEIKPKRTVWLVAFAGHYQALAGAREFVEKHFNELGSKLKMMISLDLASDSDMVAIYAVGSMYGYSRPTSLTPRYSPWIRQIFDNWLPMYQEDLNSKFHVIDGVFWSYPTWIKGAPPFEPFLRYFEAEVFTEACYGGGLGFVTTNTFRIYQSTPFDTFNNIEPDNLLKQVTIIWPLVYNSLNLPASTICTPTLNPKRVATDYGIVTATIQLSKYNKTTDWFNPYTNEDAIFFISVGATMNTGGGILTVGFTIMQTVGISKSVVVQGVTAGLFAAPQLIGAGQTIPEGAIGSPLGFTTVMKPDANGKIVLKGIKPYTGIDAQAYVVDPETGNIQMVTDTGPFGTWKVKMGTAIAPTVAGLGMLGSGGAIARGFAVYNPAGGYAYVPVFNCSSIAVLGLLDISDIADRPLGLTVNNFISHSSFIYRDVLSIWPEYMVFIEPSVPAEILVSSNQLITVLNNASTGYPEGVGYTISQGKTIILTLFDAINNIYSLANARASFLISKMSANPKMILLFNRMTKYKQLVDEAQQQEKTSSMYSFYIACWEYAIQVYQTTFLLTFDVIQTATFFFFISFAFIILIERMISGRTSGLRRMAVIIVLFIITNIILGFVHPGYTISSNVWMLLDGLAIILVILLLVYVIVDEFNTAIKSISKSILGSHQSDIERGALILSSLSLGVENLKKRPLRTSLTLSTIVIAISAMTIFTTMGVIVQPYKTSMGQAPYTGILFKRPLPQAMYSTIPEQYLYALKNITSEGLAEFQINPRAWYYPAGQIMLFKWNLNYTTIKCIWGITIEESKLLEGAIMPGEGSIFTPGIIKAALISKKLADALSKDLGVEIKPGSKINVYGIQISIMGILDDEIGAKLLEKDLDQRGIIPPDPTATSMGRTYAPLDFSNLLIVPYDFARYYFNVLPNTISASTQSTTVTDEELWIRSFDFTLIAPFDIYYGAKDKNIAFVAAKRDIYSLSGTENMIVPLLLSSLTILSMMLSSVYERTKEIATLSTVGLSPRHIGAIFIMESIALAFFGSFIGYVIGAGVTSVLWTFKAYPADLIPNVSSNVIITVMGVMMIATMLSSIYPVIKASKLATPSLLRKWRIGSKPVENMWSVSFPFNATADESLGVLNFLAEFFEASSTERTGLFMILKPVKISYDDTANYLDTTLQLSPFDAGIIQDIKFVSRRIALDKYGFDIIITKIEGLTNLWTTSNRSLLSDLRKQLLIWRALDPKEKARYIEEVKKRWPKLMGPKK